METITLAAQKRDKAMTAKDVRRLKMIPAEFYGHGVDNLSIQMDYQAFRRAYKAAGENTIITLEVEGGGKKTVLVHNVDYHPVSDEFLHVEFKNVRMDEEVTTTIPVRLEGTAPAVKDLGGTLVQALDEIEVTCLPKDLIHEFVLSVEGLVDFNTSLRVSDVKVPSTIKVNTDLEEMIAIVSAPREEEPEVVAEPVDLSQIEVTSEKKEEGEEGAAEGKKEE